MFFKAYYFLSLILLAGAIGCAWITVSKLQNASATSNVPLLPFAYFSLSALILGALQHEILLASLLSSSPTSFFLDTGLWLGVTQNALWTCAVLSLHSKQFLQILSAQTFSKTFLIVIAFALLTYPAAALTSEMFAYLDAVSTAVIFMIFAHWIRQRHLSKKFAAVFLIHGYSQLIWGSLWFNPVASWVPYTILLAFPAIFLIHGYSQLIWSLIWSSLQFNPVASWAPYPILLAFPLWRIVLLFAWIKLIPAMQSTQFEAVGDSERLALPNTADME